MQTAEEIAKSIPFSGENDSLPQTPLTQAQYTSPEWHKYDLEHVFGRRFAAHLAHVEAGDQPEGTYR